MNIKVLTLTSNWYTEDRSRQNIWSWTTWIWLTSTSVSITVTFSLLWKKNHLRCSAVTYINVKFCDKLGCSIVDVCLSIRTYSQRISFLDSIHTFSSLKGDYISWVWITFTSHCLKVPSSEAENRNPFTTVILLTSTVCPLKTCTTSPV